MNSQKYFGSDWANLVYSGFNGFLKVWRIIGKNWEIIEKKDAIAVLVYNRDRRQLVFVSQNRPAAPRLAFEVPAGHIEEIPKHVLLLDWVVTTMEREIKEEIGATVERNRIELLNPAGIFSSPGFTTEKLWFGYLEIGDADIEKDERTFGLAEENESISRRWLDIDVLSGFLSEGYFLDLKTFALVQWFLRVKYPQLVQKNGKEKNDVAL